VSAAGSGHTTVRAVGMLAALPRPAAAWLLAVSVTGVGQLAVCLGQLPAALAQGPRNLLALAPVLLIVSAAVGVRPVRLGPNTKTHLGAAPLFCAALLFAPVLAGVIAYASTLLHNLWLRRRPWNALYNAAQHLLATVGAALAYAVVGHSVAGVFGKAAALVLGGLVYFLVGTLLAATMNALAQRHAWPATVQATWRAVWSHYLTLLTFGWLAALAALAAPWSLPLLLTPVFVAYRLDTTLGDLLATRRSLADALERQRQFVGDVAHELGAPLTSVAGNAAVVLSDPALSAELRESVEDIFSEASRTSRLLQDLLLLSSVEEGAALARSPLSLTNVAEQAIRLCVAAAAAKEIALELRTEADYRVEGSQPLLEQLVINLIDNAVKYSTPGSRVQVSVAPQEGMLALAVADQGAGIASPELTSIFQRHYRAGKEQSRALGGAGLGLAIARRIADVHGGRLVAESNEGSGSRFTLLLPPM
jgi:signal transduction histidine kinase